MMRTGRISRKLLASVAVVVGTALFTACAGSSVSVGVGVAGYPYYGGYGGYGGWGGWGGYPYGGVGGGVVITGRPYVPRTDPIDDDAPADVGDRNADDSADGASLR
ncbi:MAG: hypothetical protein R3195_14940 [Gemmatimonadota bacterium]|nr:hypothetical protein [Gemmatimonadota bacterium]